MWIVLLLLHVLRRWGSKVTVIRRRRAHCLWWRWALWLELRLREEGLVVCDNVCVVSDEGVLLLLLDSHGDADCDEEEEGEEERKEELESSGFGVEEGAFEFFSDIDEEVEEENEPTAGFINADSEDSDEWSSSDSEYED